MNPGQRQLDGTPKCGVGPGAVPFHLDPVVPMSARVVVGSGSARASLEAGYRNFPGVHLATCSQVTDGGDRQVDLVEGLAHAVEVCPGGEEEAHQDAGLQAVEEAGRY